MSGRLPPASVAHLLRETRASVILTGSHLARTAEEARTILSADTHGRDIKIISAPTFFDIEQDQGKRIATPPVFSDYEYSDLSTIVVHTSGTTGLPKPIYHGHTYPLLFATCHRLPPQQELFKPNVSTLPLYHVRKFTALCERNSNVATGVRLHGAGAFPLCWIAVRFVAFRNYPDGDLDAYGIKGNWS